MWCEAGDDALYRHDDVNARRIASQTETRIWIVYVSIDRFEPLHQREMMHSSEVGVVEVELDMAVRHVRGC